MKKLVILTFGAIFLLAACTGTAAAKALPTQTKTPLPSPVTATTQPTLTAAATFTPSPSPTPTEAWIVQGPGDVTVPILLYHRIDVSPINTATTFPLKSSKRR